MTRAANLTFVEKYSYGLGAIGKDIVYATVSGFYMIYLNLVIGLDALVIGIVFALARAFDAFNDPLMGSFVDNTRSRWGKFRPWLALGTLLNAGVVILMFSDFNLSNLGDYYYYLSMYVLWGITYTIVDIPYWSFIPAISGTRDERNNISALARIFASAGGAIATISVPLILFNFGWDRSVFFTKSLVIAALFIFFMAFTVTFTREKIVVLGQKIKIREIIHIVKKNDQLLAYLCSFGIYAVAGTIMNSAGIYYFKVVLDREELMTLFVIFGGAGGMGVAMFMFPYLARKFGRRNIFIFSMAATMVGYLIMTFFAFALGGEGFALVGLFVGGWLVFFALGTASVGSTVMLADVVDYGEWKIGKRTENITFSAQCFVYKFAAALAAILIGLAAKISNIPTLDPIGEFSVPVTEAAKGIITFTIFTLPIIFVVPALIFYLRMYKLNDKYQDDILDELYKKREEKESVL